MSINLWYNQLRQHPGYSDEALERRDTCPRYFWRWAWYYVEDCAISGIVLGFMNGVPVLDKSKAGAPWFKQRCAALGLDPASGEIVGKFGRAT